jgi:hypothetical protein
MEREKESGEGLSLFRRVWAGRDRISPESQRFTLYRTTFAAVPERLKGAVCKTVGFL